MFYHLFLVLGEFVHLVPQGVRLLGTRSELEVHQGRDQFSVKKEQIENISCIFTIIWINLKPVYIFLYKAAFRQ